MAPRGLRRFILAISFTVLLMGAPSSQAWRPCGQQPLLEIVYPACAGKTCLEAKVSLPKNGRILLRKNRPGATSKFELVTSKGGRSLAVRVIAVKGQPMIQIVPRKSLRYRRGYILRRDGKDLLKFKAGRAQIAPKKPPVLKAVVTFTKAYVPKAGRVPKPGPYRYRAGRGAWVTFKSKGAQPVAARLRGVFQAPRKPPQRFNTFAAARMLFIADNGNGCWAPPPAPGEGTYRLEIVPWYAPGVQGPPITLQGKIR